MKEQPLHATLALHFANEHPTRQSPSPVRPCNKPSRVRDHIGNLFISYRRDDTADVCGRIYDRLRPEFGKDNIFKDVDTIPLGADFRKVLRDAVGQCDALLAVIGRQWLTLTDDNGHPRLHDPADFVHIEISAALARGIPVIPVLVQNARIPRQQDLPDDLAELPYRNGIEIRGDPHFHSDMDLLIQRLKPLLVPVPAQPQPVSPTVPAIPAERFPPRLAQLGFIAQILRGQEVIVPPLCYVPAGPFLIGSDPTQDRAAYDREKPQRRVTLPAFQIARFPVTVAEYACFVRGGHAEPAHWQTQLQQLNHPVVNVSWRDAVAYAQWLAACTGQPWRLPSEAEWEKAARWDPASGHARIYPWGDQFDPNRCNTDQSGIGTTTPVGSYAEGMRNGASPCGAQDMAGNVWEWTGSVYKSYPYTISDGREQVRSLRDRVLRGGSWDLSARNARAACRLLGVPGVTLSSGGFRLVCAVPSS